ncbi:hypothetical protein [Roseicitreum antarcticum]|uniref:Uncharacterized protein n=1 Tax=Roseicitreum antarcticum TaxID=564137 RepID=A0A1H3E4L9_9RHOB|nr:hypothetical protein [Roseicitreum antarcticum]SDX73682.1 hypothetical protein SAMN04488238_1189 [Roseicitreum antarcticum]
MTQLIIPGKVQQKAQHIDTTDSDGTEAYRHALDLTVNHKVISRGDVLIYCTWLRRAGQWEACLVLVPKGAVLSAERVVPCIVPLSRAYAWAEETGDFGDCLINAGYFCANLGFNPVNPKNPMKIIGIIRDCLHDLLTIPPRYEDAPKTVTAEMEVTDNATGKVKEIEVSDDHGAI